MDIPEQVRASIDAIFMRRGVGEKPPMIQYIPPDEDEEEGDYRYALTDAHRQPLARRRWTPTESSLPLGTISVVLSVLCLLTPVVAILTGFGFPVSCCLQMEGEVPPSVPLPGWMHLMMWLCVASAFLGLYAYFKSGEEDDKTGLIGALIGGMAFLVWMVVRTMVKKSMGI